MEYCKEDIQKMLNKKGGIDSNKLKKIDLTPQDCYNIFYAIDTPICEGCKKELKFLSFKAGYGTCSNRSCPLEKAKTAIKKQQSFDKRCVKEIECQQCHNLVKTKINLTICQSCVKSNKKAKILKLIPATNIEVVECIDSLLKETDLKPDHWTEKLMKSFQSVYVKLVNFRDEYKLASLIEAAFLIYYDAEIPTCVSCNSKVSFRGFKKGYARFCKKTECQWKDEKQKSLKLKNIAKTVNNKKIEENIGNSSYYNSIYNNMEKVNKKFTYARYIDEFDDLEDFDKHVEFLDFLEPDDLRQRYHCYKNKIFEEKKCLNCGKELSNVFKDFCSNRCVAIYNKENRIEANLRIRGVEYPTQCKDVINKREQQTLEKYGVHHHMHLQEFKDKCMNVKIEKYGSNFALMSYKTKTFTTPSGKEVKYQGYENFLLQEIYNTYDEEDVVNDVQSLVYYDNVFNKHRYFPDLYIKSTDTLYEVKSEYTLKQSLNNNILYYKIQSAVIEFSCLILIVYNTKGETIFETTFNKENFEENFKNIVEKYK